MVSERAKTDIAHPIGGVAAIGEAGLAGAQAGAALRDSSLIRLIAEKVMSWPVLTAVPTQHMGSAHPHQGDHGWLSDPSNYPHVLDYGNRLLLWREPDADGEEWNPVTNVAAAWEVVEWMTDHSQPDWCTFEMRRSTWWDDPTWGYDVRFGEQYNAMHQRERVAWARTAPLAICTAALKARGIEI